MTALLRAALAGAATGGRSFTGLAALALSAPSQAATQPDRALSTSWVKGLTTLLAAQELVLDKLPRTPSRLAPVGLGARCATAAAAGLIIARRVPATVSALAPGQPGEAGAARLPAPSAADTIGCAAVATAAAVGAAWLGTKWRGWAAARTGHDYIGACLEDALTLGLARLSSRAPSHCPSVA